MEAMTFQVRDGMMQAKKKRDRTYRTKILGSLDRTQNEQIRYKKTTEVG